MRLCLDSDHIPFIELDLIEVIQNMFERTARRLPSASRIVGEPLLIPLLFAVIIRPQTDTGAAVIGGYKIRADLI